jgi:hypothetical protein
MLPISLLETETREPNQVIAIEKNKEEDLVALLSGKRLIKDALKVNQLFVFKSERKAKFEMVKRVVIKDLP